MMPKPPRRKTCDNCKHLRRELARGRTSDGQEYTWPRMYCDVMGLATVGDEFGCGLWEGKE